MSFMSDAKNLNDTPCPPFDKARITSPSLVDFTAIPNLVPRLSIMLFNFLNSLLAFSREILPSRNSVLNFCFSVATFFKSSLISLGKVGEDFLSVSQFLSAINFLAIEANLSPSTIFLGILSSAVGSLGLSSNFGK